MSKELNTDQLAAITSYAAHVGDNWKSTLQADWMRSGPAVSNWRAMDWAFMQQIRNNFGPSWLATFELPVQEAAPNFRDIYRNAVR